MNSTMKAPRGFKGTQEDFDKLNVNAKLAAVLASNSEMEAALATKTTALRVTARRKDTDYETTVEGKKVMAKGKGTVCVYGINSRMPVSLYPNQWEKLIGMIPQIQETIAANKDALSFEKA